MSRQKGNTRRTYFPVRVRIHKKGKGAWTHGAPKLFEKRGHSDGNRPAAACRRHVLPHLYRGAYRRRGHGPVPVDLHGLHNGRHPGYGGAFGGSHASFGGTAGHRRPRQCARSHAPHTGAGAWAWRGCGRAAVHWSGACSGLVAGGCAGRALAAHFGAQFAVYGGFGMSAGFFHGAAQGGAEFPRTDLRAGRAHRRGGAAH